MLELTFSRALFLFTIVLTLVYIVFLILSEKTTARPEKPTKNVTGILNRLVTYSLFLEVPTLFLLNAPAFRDTSIFSILIILITCLLLWSFQYASNIGNSKVLFIPLIIFHLILNYSPPLGLNIAEGGSTTITLFLKGRWDTTWALSNPVYNPFPMFLSIFNSIIEVTAIPFLSVAGFWLISLALVPAYDIILYSLTKRLANSHTAGLFAIFLFAMLPPANLSLHLAKWIASLLVLISILALIKVYDRSHPLPNTIIAGIGFGAAILFHTSAIIGAFTPLSIVVISYILKRIKIAYLSLFENRFFTIWFVFFILLAFTRMIYTQGYLDNITLPALASFILTMIGSPPATENVPVYDQAVNPINAYAWSTMLAMASALIIFSLLKKRKIGDFLIFPIYFVGASFIGLGLLFAISGATYSSVRAAMYPAYAFVAPAAAVVGEKIYKASRSQLLVFMVLIILLIASALSDPMFSYQKYQEAGAQDIAPTIDDYTVALFLVDVVPTRKTLMTSYAIISSFGYLEVIHGKPTHKYYSTPAGSTREIVSAVVENKELVNNVIYIWPQLWHKDILSELTDVPINIYSNSGTFAVFENT